MKENILSVVIALLLASFIFFGLLINFDSFDSLQNNVIGAQQEELEWDVVLDTYTDRIEIIANKNIDKIAAMSVMIFWNENEVNPLFEGIESLWNAEVTEAYGARVTLFINALDGLRKNDTIMTIPLEWDVNQISISDVVLLFTDDSSERASISTR